MINLPRLITTDANSPLDQSRGRVHLIGGDFFYSPNSRRDIQLPQVYDDTLRDPYKDTITEFHQPLWWHPACPYLAFLPIRPVFIGVPFQDFFDIPSYFERVQGGGFRIDSLAIIKWATAEKDMMEAVERLLAHHHAPKISWIARTSIGCAGRFKRAHVLRAYFTASRYWFSLWMAGLSYAITVSLTLCHKDLDDGIPHWFSYLSDRGWSQIWLSGIRSSLVATFDSSIDRAGVFVQLLPRNPDQISVDWLCKFGVPVWYPWNSREVQASSTDTRLARFAPPPHQLQEPSTFLTKDPSPPLSPQPAPPVTLEPVPPPISESQTGGFDCKLFFLLSSSDLYLFHLGAASSIAIASWKAFFEKRRERNERLKMRETPKQRQSRESREKNPPTRRTKVFMWRRLEDGGYRRESYYQAENGVHLDTYGENQKIYDAFSNEWDCCHKFGELSGNEVPDDNDNDYDDDYPMMPPPSAAVLDDDDDDDYPMVPTPSAAVADLPASVSQPTPADEARPFTVVGPADMPFDWEQFETSKLMYDIYGFVVPLPLPTRPSSIDKKGPTLLSRAVRLRRNDSEFFESSVASFALEFLELLGTSKTPKNSTWDISSANRMSIMGSELFHRMRVIEHMEGKWYAFDFKEAATVPWTVAVPNVADALYVCRLHQTGGLPLTDFEVARELLNRGIGFSTLLPVKSLPRSIRPLAITVPVRLPDYAFTRDDYYAYEQERAALLSNPRIARSALLRGGIVWCLAVATLSFNDVLKGPTTAATVHRQGIVFKTSDNSTDLCDDGLTQLELDVICGLHYCYTGLFPLLSAHIF